MFKINQTQFVSSKEAIEKKFFHRVFRSSLYSLDPSGDPPHVTCFNDYIKKLGRMAVIMSSHEFNYQDLIK